MQLIDHDGRDIVDVPPRAVDLDRPCVDFGQLHDNLGYFMPVGGYRINQIEHSFSTPLYVTDLDTLTVIVDGAALEALREDNVLYWPPCPHCIDGLVGGFHVRCPRGCPIP